MSSYGDEAQHSYSVSLSYLLLGATAGYCFSQTNISEYQFIHLTYYGILTHCTPGIVKFAWAKGDNPIYWDTLLLETMTSLPWFTANLYMKYNISWTIAALQGFIPLILLVPELVRRDPYLQIEQIFNLSIGMCALSACGLCYVKRNYHGLLATLVYAMVHFGVKNLQPNYYMTATKQNIYNVGVTLFCLLALEADWQAFKLFF